MKGGERFSDNCPIGSGSGWGQPGKVLSGLEYCLWWGKGNSGRLQNLKRLDIGLLFDPVKEAEQIFETEEFTEKQNDEEETRLTAGIQKILAKSKKPFSNERNKFISELNSKKVLNYR